MTVSSCSLDVGLATPTELMAMQVMLQQQAGGEQQGGGVGWGGESSGQNACTSHSHPFSTLKTQRGGQLQKLCSLCTALHCSAALRCSSREATLQWGL